MKRFLRTLSLAGLTAILVLVGGCDITDLNEDPNVATEAATGNLMTNAQIDFANIYWRDYAGAFWMRYAQYLTTNQYTDGDRFRFPSRRPGANNFNWETMYFVLNDLEEIKRLNRADPEATGAFGPADNQIAMATIMQAFVLHTLTDIYGPIPLEDALKGRSDGTFAPTYSSQETVYGAILDSLTQASNRIDPSAATMTGNDLVFSGDMDRWKKFANALKMRVAIRMSDQDPATAETALQEALDAGTFESVDDGAEIAFSSSPPYQNPIFENYEVDGRDDWAAPEGIVGVMNDNDDPRRSVYFTDADGDADNGNQFVGFPYGLEQGPAQALSTSEDFSRPGTAIRQATSPAILMLYDEVLFIQAEAAVRGLISGDADALFEEAVRASMEYWGVTDEAAVDAYVANLETPTTDNYRQVIGVQKWLAQYLQGVQGWSTWRRMDFQGILQIPEGDPGQSSFGKSYPVRMTYPRDEATLNGANLDSAINNLLGGSGASAGDTQGVLLWWDTEYVSP